ncbi:hypothetical protein [Thauera linaloolentis]|uniref:Uncharacterized protein n=1 Tax=Thauera linaloolentis (strain DSM 12138 / JCM 21573 / CCUG 41526 / CIP 105981 / IAM 15112 / NBRC 102519 / 47Lol) TaxID=1123367 RepID=N6ZE64_THAL4|nr:hypothetical protein [Thauera linaloolentis]ENO90434.1 hypothetical protein C666_00980 [Thauera linaloolentis 47Lol = DSM 12138]MCM8566295.1 hypothetical protein [Thauera linaloolentis]
MRYSPPDHYSLSVHKCAEEDLDALYELDEDGAAAIDVFLEEASSSQEILDRFTIQDYRSYSTDFDYDIKRWKQLWGNFALWRARLFDVPNVAANHRIIYALHPIERRYYVLGIVPRDFDYDSDHPLSKRIIRTYGELDLP